jgi:hypothetical protein
MVTLEPMDPESGLKELITGCAIPDWPTASKKRRQKKIFAGEYTVLEVLGCRFIFINVFQ